MRIKNTIYSLSIILSITLIGGLLPTKPANAASLSYAMDPSISTNKVLTLKETSQVKSEINVLKDCHIDTSAINRVKVTTMGNEYILNCGNHDEKVMIKSNNAKGVTLTASDGKRNNVIFLAKDGSIILDGHKVQISQVNQINTNLAVSPNMIIYRSVKSLSPYGSLQSYDYSEYLASGRQNIKLGEDLDLVASSALALFISYTVPYSGIIISLTTIATQIRDLLIDVNPKTQYLGLAYTTYTTPGGDDYQYYNAFYANTACTGTYKLEISYEHFMVY